MLHNKETKYTLIDKLMIGGKIPSMGFSLINDIDNNYVTHTSSVKHEDQTASLWIILPRKEEVQKTVFLSEKIQ